MSFTQNPYYGYSDILNRFDISDADEISVTNLTVTGNAQLTYLSPYQLLCLDNNKNVTGKTLNDGQFLIGQTGGSSTPATLTGSANIPVTLGPNSISIDTVQNIQTTSSPTFMTETLTGLNASQLVSTNGTKQLISSNLQGTTNQVNVSGQGTATITLSTPQDIATSSSPTFVTETLSGLNALQMVASNGSKQLISSNLQGTTNQISVTGQGTSTVTLSTPQDIATSSTPTFVTETLSGLNASQFVNTNASKQLISSNLQGTTNQVNVTGQGTATVTLSTPQDIATSSSPTFSGLTLTGLTSYTGPSNTPPVVGVLTIDSTNTIRRTAASDVNSISAIVQRDKFGSIGISFFTLQHPLNSGLCTIAYQNTSSNQVINISYTASSANLVLDQGTYTIPNKWTFSNATPLNFSGLTISKPLLLDGSGNVTSGFVDISSQITGVLPIGNGGTNSSTALSNGCLMVSSGGKIIEGTSSTNPSFTQVNFTSGAFNAGSLSYSIGSNLVLNAFNNLTLQGNSITVLNLGGGTVFESYMNLTLRNSKSVIFDTGTFQTTLSPGVPSASVTYTLPAAAPTANNQLLLSSTSGAMNWTTATYPVTTTANRILYSSSTNTIGEITTANNGVLITSNLGVPSISSTLPTAVQNNITQTGTITTATTFSNTTDSSSTSTGAVIVSGGVGIAKKLYAGDNIIANGASNVCNAGFQTQYAVCDNAGGTITVSSGSDTLLTWSNRSLVGITYSSGTFTCPKAGIYLCTASMHWGAPTAVCYMYFYKNASNAIQYGCTQIPANGTSCFNWTTTATIKCAVNDTIGFYVNQQSGVNQAITPVCLGITLISAT